MCRLSSKRGNLSTFLFSFWDRHLLWRQISGRSSNGQLIILAFGSPCSISLDREKIAYENNIWPALCSFAPRSTLVSWRSLTSQMPTTFVWPSSWYQFVQCRTLICCRLVDLGVLWSHSPSGLRANNSGIASKLFYRYTLQSGLRPFLKICSLCGNSWIRQSWCRITFL